MKAKEIIEHTEQFLSGGGEMGELTRIKDWSKTPLGNPGTWPQSLRTTLSIILSSKFPMFLWWGPELICFYNDAYRPSLGNNGKHPSILGMEAAKAWPEIWDVIKPLIDQVLTEGESTWSEDQLIPIYRNGKMEDVYWTFSYSPVRDESGKVAGVLVTCNETTEKVLTLKSLETLNKQYYNNIMQAPVAMCMFKGKDHVVEIVNQLMLEIWGKTNEQVINKPIFEGLPEAKGQGLEELLDNVYRTGDKYVGNERAVDLLRNGSIETTYVNFVYEAFREANGHISGVVAVVNEVKAQVIARKKIEESEEQLNIVIEASDMATWELNLETRKVTHSPRYLEILGFHKNENPTHQEILKRISQQDIEIRNSAFQKAFKTGELRFSSKIVWPDDSIHWIDVRGKVFYDKSNNPVNVIGTMRDITEEKKYQQQLEEREQKFRLLADSMPQHVWTSDSDGNLNYFNQSVYNYSGLTREQIEKEGWIQIVHPNDREKNVIEWANSINTGSDFLLEHRFRRYDGTYRWQLSRAIPQRDAQGNIQMWVGTSTDIQDQKTFASELEKQVQTRTKELKHLYDALAKSEERYHLMVEEVQDYAILYLDRNGIIENWNKGAEKIKGYKADEIIGKSFSLFYTEQDKENNLPESMLNTALTSGKALQEGWRVRKDGTYFWASIVITAVHNDKNEVIGFSKVTHDLTEKKEADNKIRINSEQLAQKNAELEKMNAELQSFAYVSSHDLQEPLRKIQTFSSRIIEKESENLTETGKDYFRRMQDAAKRMQILIEDLLAYSRTSTTERVFKNTNLHEIINEVKIDLKELITEKHVVIEEGKMCDVSIIPFQFRQLMHNLFSNSIKFAKEGIPCHIKIESKIESEKKLNINHLHPQKKYCHISISDNGIGFESQYKERIFEVFQRLHGKSEYKGTGIGLAIVKKIVENHNGIIEAHGELNVGARFDIYIPVS